MDHFEAVIFDMDGLLIDSERLAMDAFLQTCENYQITGLEQIIKTCIGTNSRKTKAILTPYLSSIVDYDQFRESWEQSYLDAIEQGKLNAKPGAQSLLEHLKRMAMPIGLATSSETQKARNKLIKTGLMDYFSVIVGGETVSESKPNPEIFLKAAAQLGARPENCLALEDSHNGVRAAHAAGMVVVQVPDLVLPCQEIKALGHIILQSLEQVPDYQFVQN